MSRLSIKWRVRDGVVLKRDPADTVTISADDGTTVALSAGSPCVADALLRLAKGADERELLDAVGGDTTGSARILYDVERLRRHGLLLADLWADQQLYATLLPRTRDFAVSPPQDVSRTWQLCRFAWLHRVGDDLVLECPDAMCAALVHHPELIKWIYRASAATAFRADQEEAAVMALLGELGFLVNPEEQESAAQRTWEFHDRMFHRRSQLFEDFQPRGGTYRFRTDGADSSSEPVPSPPAVRPAYAGEAIDLPIPSRDDGASLREVMERRRSKRAMGSSPATLAQVAELLYRVARTRDVREAPVQDLVDRPYPSGGAIHELEFYLAIHRCSGLAPGFFHYRGAEHGLTRLTGAEPIAKAMIADCAEAWGRPDRLPDCLIVLSSRLPRLAWKYEAIAYKISLMNAGVVLQSLYLVSTDLGLNGAAVGSSRPDLFGAATGNSSWEETSIAGFGFGGG